MIDDFPGTLYLAKVRSPSGETIQVSLDTEGITWLVFYLAGKEQFRAWIDQDKTAILADCLRTVVRMGSLE